MKLSDKHFASMDAKLGVFKFKNMKFMVLTRRTSDIVSGVSDKFNFIYCWAMLDAHFDKILRHLWLKSRTFSENNDDESISTPKGCSQNSV